MVTDDSPNSNLPPTTIVVATNNAGKTKELHELLRDLPIDWVRVSDITGKPFSVIEDGETFEENALIKAKAACQATGIIALADDSGLQVDALFGHPGVRSARFAHERATDGENNLALMTALKGVGLGARGARFRCALAVVSPLGDVPLLATGCCEGRIGFEPQGNGGFGYDPLFIVEGHGGRTMAELTPDEKNRSSHRGEAVRQLRPQLARLILSMAAAR